MGSGREIQWHCFHPVDNLPTEKQVSFVELYRELNRVMIEKPSVLNLLVLDKQWEYMEFPVKVGAVARRFACSSLLVFARKCMNP